MALKGTLINTVAILAGTLIGLLVGNRYPEKMKQTVMSGLGLVTSIIGIKMAFSPKIFSSRWQGLHLVESLENCFDLDLWINRLGDSLEKIFTKAGRGSSGNSASAPTQGHLPEGLLQPRCCFALGQWPLSAVYRMALQGISALSLPKPLLTGLPRCICFFFRAWSCFFSTACVHLSGSHFPGSRIL